MARPGLKPGGRAVISSLHLHLATQPIKHNLKDIPVITAGERELLLNLARSLSGQPDRSNVNVNPHQPKVQGLAMPSTSDMLMILLTCWKATDGLTLSV